MGKTARLMHELLAEDRVVVVDPKCAQLAKLAEWEHVWPGYDADAKKWSDSSVPLFFLENRNSFRVVVHFRSDYKQNLELLCLFLKSVKHLVLAVDEIGLFCPPGPSQSLGPRMTELVVSGTHEGIQLISTAQRPSMVHGTIRSIANRMIFYRVDERNDKAVAGNYLSLEMMEQLPGLETQVCIEWSDYGQAFLNYSLKGKLGRLLPGDRFQA